MMGYWIFLLFLFALLALMIFLIYMTKKKDNDRNIIYAGIITCGVICIMLTLLCIDIPCALSGGEKIYVNEVPKVINIGHFQFIYIDGKRFASYIGFDPDDYEPNTRYCISYTKFTKSFLGIEKVE